MTFPKFTHEPVPGKQNWVKVYYRDSNKVMRVIPGVQYLPGSVIILDESVYTLSRYNKVVWMDVKR